MCTEDNISFMYFEEKNGNTQTHIYKVFGIQFKFEWHVTIYTDIIDFTIFYLLNLNNLLYKWNSGI